MRRRYLIALSLILCLPGAALAQEGDAAKGQEIAQAQCARCHDVTKGGAFKKMPPSFQSIAIYRTKPDIWARIIAPSPHAAMPDMTWTLTSEQVQDVLAYILSLDTPVSLPQ
ncbi:c-type cytochrome [Aestuariivirga sp.]|uniref:c-type cytochrome n=1 Tax=Aestuariivirga sp. TaxID=2650926 RepID=UPI00391CEDEC